MLLTETELRALRRLVDGNYTAPGNARTMQSLRRKKFARRRAEGGWMLDTHGKLYAARYAHACLNHKELLAASNATPVDPKPPTTRKKEKA